MSNHIWSQAYFRLAVKIQFIRVLYPLTVSDCVCPSCVYSTFSQTSISKILLTWGKILSSAAVVDH